MAKGDNWIHVGEFKRSIGMGAHIRFLVERSTDDHALHRVLCDEGLGNGPREVCTFAEPATAPTTWQRAWDGDSMSPGIEADARVIARKSLAGRRS